MAHYTEIYVNVDLKEDTPPHILDTLSIMCGDAGGPLPEDLPARWAILFSNGSYYTPLTSCCNLTFDDIGNHWSLLGKGDIKNYEGEVEAFFIWLMPWVEGDRGDFIGYHRYEDRQDPVLIFKGGC